MTAIFLAILSSKVPKEIAKHVPSAALKAGLPESSLLDLFAAIAKGTPAALAAVPGINLKIEEAVGASLSNAYASAYAYVYYAALAVGGVGVIACFCIKDYDKVSPQTLVLPPPTTAPFPVHLQQPLAPFTKPSIANCGK